MAQIRKWKGVEGVFLPSRAPSYFGFKEAGYFNKAKFIVITEEQIAMGYDSRFRKAAAKHGMVAEQISEYVIGFY